MDRSWNATLMDQLEFPWDHQFLPRLEGLTTAEYDRWSEGVRALGEDGLFRPCGPAEGPFAEAPFRDLILHIHREFIHHAAEVMLLRDLYRDTAARGERLLNTP